MNLKHYVVFDFETGGLDPLHHEAIQLAGKMYDGKTLKEVPLEMGGEFTSLMKPFHFDRLEPGAMAKNKISVKDLEAAPDQKVVWTQFITWVNQFNQKKSVAGAPIACGKNIRRFDFKFVEQLNLKHAKAEKTVLFDRRRELDLEDFIYHWFESDPALTSYSMDSLRDYFGLPHDGAHSAIVDVRQTGLMLMDFLSIYRNMRSRTMKDGSKLVNFKNRYKVSDHG